MGKIKGFTNSRVRRRRNKNKTFLIKEIIIIIRKKDRGINKKGI